MCSFEREHAAAGSASLQPRQFSSHSRASARGAALVADQYPRQTREDRREARHPCSLHHLPDGRGSSAPRPVPPYPRQHRGSAVSSTDPMLTASSEPCIGTDGRVAPGPRENHAFCAGRADLLSDWSVKERLKVLARKNPVAQCRPTRQSCPQSTFSWRPSGKCRYEAPQPFLGINPGIYKMRKMIVWAWNFIFNAEVSPLRYIQDKAMRHYVLQALGFMWAVSFSVAIGSYTILAANIIGHVVLIGAAAITAATYATAKVRPLTFGRIKNGEPE